MAGAGGWGATVQGDRALVLQDETVLEMDAGDGGPAMGTCLRPLNWALKCGENCKSHVYFSTIKKICHGVKKITTIFWKWEGKVTAYN